MANHEEYNLNEPRIEQNEKGEYVLKGGLQLEKLATWENSEENAEIHQSEDFERSVVMSMDFNGLKLEDALSAMYRKFIIQARNKFRKMDPHEAVAFVDGLPDDSVPEYGDTKRIEWSVAGGTDALFSGPMTAGEIAARIESGDYDPDELDDLIERLQQIREEQS